MSIAMPRTFRSAAATAIAGLALAALVLTTGHAGGDDDGGGRPQADVDRSATPARSAYPSSMDALGASVAAGYNTDCPDGWIDCPDNSWATGANPAVDSVYLRLLALNPRLKDHNANDAESGTAMVALDGQAESAVQRGVDLVTIAMGTNDACGRRTGVMTDVSEFRDEFRQALDTLTTGLPLARIHVVSIPDLYRMWETLHTDPRAMSAWRAVAVLPDHVHASDLERTGRRPPAGRRPRASGRVQRGAGRCVRDVSRAARPTGEPRFGRPSCWRSSRPTTTGIRTSRDRLPWRNWSGTPSVTDWVPVAGRRGLQRPAGRRPRRRSLRRRPTMRRPPGRGRQGLTRTGRPSMRRLPRRSLSSEPSPRPRSVSPPRMGRRRPGR